MCMFTGQSFIIVQCWEKFHHHSIMHAFHSGFCVCVPFACMCVCLCVCEREEGSDHAATIKLSPWQKVAVSNEIVLFIKYIC